MEYYVKPTLVRGTNDVRHSSPQEIKNAISMLRQNIKELPTTNLAISEVISRNDEPSLNMKIMELTLIYPRYVLTISGRLLPTKIFPLII